EQRPESPTVVLPGEMPVAPVAEPLSKHEAREAPVWSGWDIVGLLVFGFAALIVASLVVVMAAKATPAYRGATLAELTTDPKLLVIATACGYVGVLGLMLALIRRHGLSFRAGIQCNSPRARSAWFLLLVSILAVL